MTLPGYRRMLAAGELPARLADLRGLLRPCRLCGRRCGVDRIAGEKGFCGAGVGLEVASSCVHHGEEPVLGGSRGVGNVFFGRCSLRCVFCQNWAISQPGSSSPAGWEMSREGLADILLGFQREGCPAAGFVTPTHFAPQLFEALADAAERGFSLPVIYNTGGYDTPELLELLDGLVDIYLPDFKYAEEAPAVEYSAAPGYPEAAKAALREMHGRSGGWP